MEIETTIKIPDETQENGFKTLKAKEVPNYMKSLAELNIREVISHPEISYDKAYKIYKKITAIEPAKHADEVMLWFMVMVRASLQSYEREVHETVNKPSSTEAIRKAIALSSFVGYCYIVGLADMAHLSHWMMKVTVGEKNKFIRENLMQIVKVNLMLFMQEKKEIEDSECDNCLMAMIDAINEENPFDEGDMEEVEYRIQ